MARPMTMAEKILAHHAGLEEVELGQLIECDVDLVLANDVTAPIAISSCKEISDTVWDPSRVVLVCDHYVPNKDIKSAEEANLVRDFAREQGITHFYEVGCMGIEHALLPEQGIVGAGDLVIGADSHTCTYGALGAFATGVGSTDAGVAMATGKAWFKVPETIKFQVNGKLAPGVTGKDLILHIIGLIGVDGALYKAMEFAGTAIEALSMDERMTISNMAIEAGGKAGLIQVDETSRKYMFNRTERPYNPFYSDTNAQFAEVIEIDAEDVKPTVAYPSLPSNVHLAEDSRDIAIDQVVIGSCTNGRIEDMRQAASVLRGNKVAEGVRCIIIPATQQVYRDCIKEGLAEVFLDANCAISTPTCGPCLGGHMGVLAAGERACATTNRNFVGRMGHPESEVYLASPIIAAATAVLGHIGMPEDIPGWAEAHANANAGAYGEAESAHASGKHKMRMTFSEMMESAEAEHASSGHSHAALAKEKGAGAGAGGAGGAQSATNAAKDANAAKPHKTTPTVIGKIDAPLNFDGESVKLKFD